MELKVENSYVSLYLFCISAATYLLEIFIISIFSFQFVCNKIKFNFSLLSLKYLWIALLDFYLIFCCIVFFCFLNRPFSNQELCVTYLENFIVRGRKRLISWCFMLLLFYLFWIKNFKQVIFFSPVPVYLSYFKIPSCSKSHSELKENTCKTVSITASMFLKWLYILKEIISALFSYS